MTNAMENSHNALPIVVGIDGSDPSKQALAWAARQSQLTGTHLEIISTWEYPTTFAYPGMMWPVNMPLADEARRTLEQTVDEVLGAGDHKDLTMTVIEGHPAVTLAEHSRSASLIVVGSRGHGEFAGMLLGSVSEFLATHAHCPVLIVRADNAKDS
jgi:nucleotide-binding universal stress UspA family protein